MMLFSRLYKGVLFHVFIFLKVNVDKRIKPFIITRMIIWS